MARGHRGQFLRDNAFLVAAVALPPIVVIFFLLASAVPRYLVPPPAYDLLLRASGPYEGSRSNVALDFAVRDGRVEATVRPAAANEHPTPSGLFLFDHETMNVRQIPVDVPRNLTPGEPARTFDVAAFPGKRILAQAKAPDGYQLGSRDNRGPGLLGSLFGMDRYGRRTSIVNRGRVVPIEFPSGYDDQYAVHSLGWLVSDERR